MKILRIPPDSVVSDIFRQDSTGSDSRILRLVELNPAVNVRQRCISGTNRRENDVNTTDRYSEETA
jgi:hypothetical protein